MGTTTDADLVRLEDLIRDMAQLPGDTVANIREHLEAARFYRTGSMPEEYDFSVQQARELLPRLEDAQLRSRIEDVLHL